MTNADSREAPDPSALETAAAEARDLLRCGLKAALATLDAGTGRPHVSLITVASAADASPLFLISSLARHTRNLAADPRASILIDGTGGAGDPLEGSRVTVVGTARESAEKADRRRFLARHPTAEAYAGFADFALWRLDIEGAHFIGGFGRIHDLPREALVRDTAGAEALLEAEPEIVAHMNADHADAVELYATKLLGAPAGPWRFAGCDPEGCDLVLGDRALRLAFPGRVTTPQTARECLVALAREARNRDASNRKK